MRGFTVFLCLLLNGLSECSFKHMEASLALHGTSRGNIRSKRSADPSVQEDKDNTIPGHRDLYDDSDDLPVAYPFQPDENTFHYDAITKYVNKLNEKEQTRKRPFVFGNGDDWGKRADDLENDENNVDKRPFVLGSGMFGKRPFVSGSSYKLGKRPFVLGSGYSFGKRDSSTNEDLSKRPFVFGDYGSVDKRPFVLGSGYRFGKRNEKTHPNFGFESDDDVLQKLFKRPFVLSGGYRYGKRSDDFEGIAKRPFVLGSGFQFGKRDIDEQILDKRPFVLSGGYNYGKRDNFNLDDIDKRPFVLGSGFSYGKREDTRFDDVSKRPFVLGSGYTYGKRHDSFSQSVDKRPFVLRGGYNFGKRNYETYDSRSLQAFLKQLGEAESDFDTSDLEKRPFVFGGPYTFGRVYEFGKTRESDPNLINMAKRPFVLGGPYTFGKVYEFGKRGGDTENNEYLPGENDEETDRKKRPFVLGGGYAFGKRPYKGVNRYTLGKRDIPIYRNDELSDYVDDFMMDKRPFVMNDGIGKRPFVFNGGPSFGKRPLVMGNYKIGKRSNELDSDSEGERSKRPFGRIYGSGFNFGKRAKGVFNGLEFDRVHI